MKIKKIIEIIYIFGGFVLFGTSPIFASSAYIPQSLIESTFSTNPNSLINNIIKFGFIVIGLIFFIVIVIGGIEWMISGGDEKKKEGAQGRLINAIIGITIVAGSYLIVEIISSLFGVSSIFSKNLFTYNCNQSSSSSICLN